MTTQTPTATLRDIAAALRRAEAGRVAIAQPSTSVAGLTVDDAYAVQRENITRRIEHGDRLVGRKIGLTSEAIQRQLGVDSPDFGAILASMVVPNDGDLDRASLLAPRAEAEFAFRIGADLPASPTPDELVAAIDGVAVAIEVIDSRIADWKITLVDTVADNASSARIVVGEFTPATAEVLGWLPGTEIALTRDDVTVTAGPGSAVLGDPLLSLHWLADAIGEYGESFRAGDVVLAGAVSAAVDLDRDAVWTAAAAGFAPVSFRTIEGGLS